MIIIHCRKLRGSFTAFQRQLNLSSFCTILSRLFRLTFAASSQLACMSLFISDGFGLLVRVHFAGLSLWLLWVLFFSSVSLES